MNPDAPRKFHWQERRAWVRLWKATNLDAARRDAARLREMAAAPGELRTAAVRQGDVERLAGRFAEAQRFYAAAQELACPPRKLAAQDRKHPRRTVREDAEEDAAWRTRVIRGAAYPARLRLLLNQKQLEEAGKLLVAWECEFPLDKLGDDEPLQEAAWLDADGNPEAALRLLEALRVRGACSGGFPDLLAAEIGLFQKLGRKDDAKRTAAELVAQFPNHPAAASARSLLTPEKKKGGR